MYIITKKNTFHPANEVYFAYDLNEAMDLKAELNEQDPADWVVAVVLS